MSKYNQSGGYQNRSGGGKGRSGSRDNGPVKIPEAQPVQFYLDPEKKKLNPELLDKLADQAAESIRKELNSAQLRRFFGEVKGLYIRLEHQEPFDRLLPLIKMLRSKVYYAMNPKKKKIEQEFASFMLGGISQIKDEQDFKAFVMYFEAVVGFMYGKGLVSK